MAKAKRIVPVFVDGVHYAAGPDGHADKTRPLRWENGAYRPAQPGEPLHNDVNHLAELTIEPGSED